MNFHLSVLFLPLSVVPIFCDNCSSGLHETLVEHFNLNNNLVDECQVLHSELLFRGITWTGFCFRRRCVFFPDWKCRKRDFEPNYVGVFVEANHHFCQITDDKRNFIPNEKCMQKYNTEQCRRKNSHDAPESAGIPSEEPRTQTPYAGTKCSPPPEGNATWTESHIYSDGDVSWMEAKAHGADVTDRNNYLITKGRGIRKIFDDEASLKIHGVSLPSRGPCQSHELFFMSYCYFVKGDKNMKSGSMTISETRAEVGADDFLTRVSAKVTQECRLYHEDALGLAVESAEENTFVFDLLRHKINKSRNLLIMTSGIKVGNATGKWLDWGLIVNESAIALKSEVVSETALLYVITSYGHDWRWQLLNLSSILSHKGSELMVMCKRLYNPRRVDGEFYKRCLLLYKGSHCYDPLNLINYCCAVDEREELWFGCPNEICFKEDQAGSNCSWTCGNEGAFVKEYPSCRKNIACDTTFVNVRYSAPMNRYALGGCLKNLFGYSSWYCSANKTFAGVPNYSVCCNTNSTCRGTDSYLNTWTSCVSKTAIKRVTCPPGSLVSEAIAEWQCLENKTFRGNLPDYSNCNRSAIACRKNDKYGREWTAGRGATVKKSCPGDTKGLCFWQCGKTGDYGTPEPDCSTCGVRWTEALASKIKNGTDYKEAMRILSNHTSKEDLTLGFSHVLNVTSACVDLFRRQSSRNRTAFDGFLADYSNVLKDVAGKPHVWSSFTVSSRREYAYEIVNVTQKAAFSYLRFQSAFDEESAYNATFSDFEKDGFEFFVLYNSSLLGAKFPLENYPERNWGLEVKGINESVSNFAAMGLIMNYSLSCLMFPLGNHTNELEMNSPAVTFTVATSQKGKAVLVPDVFISLTFKHINRTRLPESKIIKRRIREGEKPSGVFGSTVCYYFRYSDWSSEGCRVTYTSREVTRCLCNHLSTITLLMGIHQYHPDSVLELVSLISSSITIMALLLTLTVFFTFDTVKNERVLIGINLCFCLILGHVLLLTVMDKRFFYISDSLCTVYAILLHYVFMAAFAWMFVEGCHLYRMLVLVFDSNIEYRLIYLLIGYGMPLLIVCVTALVGYALQEQPYGQDELCWLKTPNYVWAFNGPVVVLTSINFVILIMAVKLAIASKMRTEKSSFASLRIWIKGCISLSALLGVTWLFGIAYIYYNQFFSYSFVILNGLQGFFIFLFRCVCNVQYKNAFLNKIKLCFSHSDEPEDRKKLEAVKIRRKLFAITQSGSKLSATDIRGKSKSVKMRKKGEGKRILPSLFKFSRRKRSKEKMKGFAEEESSSGIVLDFEAPIVPFPEGISSSRPTESDFNMNSCGDKEGRRRTTCYGGQGDFPELSYHSNHFSG